MLTFAYLLTYVLLNIFYYLLIVTTYLFPGKDDEWDLVESSEAASCKRRSRNGWREIKP